MKVIFSIVFFLASYLLQAQDKELGLSIGTLYYLGELNQTPYHKPLPAIGINYRRSYQKRLALNYQIALGRIQGADSNSTDPRLVNRNLSFRSDLAEASLCLEINYFEFEKNSTKHWATPYLFFGFSFFYSNPQALQNGEWRNLQAIGTEGQGRGQAPRYNLFNFAIPLGIGFKANLSDKLSVTFFTGMRKTFTDYIDDVGGVYASPSLFDAADAALADPSKQSNPVNGTNQGIDRGNSNTKDWYNFTGFTLSFKTNTYKSKCPRW